MAENTGKRWRKLKEGLKGSTTFGKTVRNTQLARTCFGYKQIWLFATKDTRQFQFWKVWQAPMYITLKTKTTSKNQKNQQRRL